MHDSLQTINPHALGGSLAKLLPSLESIDTLYDRGSISNGLSLTWKSVKFGRSYLTVGVKSGLVC